MKTPWNNLPTRDERALVEVVGYLNTTLDELLSLAKHVAPAIERITQVDAGGIKMTGTYGLFPEDVKFWLVKTSTRGGRQVESDVTELMTHHKTAGEAPQHHRENSYQAIAWASGWEALRCALLGIEQR